MTSSMAAAGQNLMSLTRDASDNGSELQTSERVRQTNEPASFPLFDLPPELRNLVYEKVAENRTAYLANGRVDDGSGLLAAGAKLHYEYLPILLLYASSVRAEVLNFDFRDVIYSLNRLSAAGLNSLSSTSQPRRQQLHIHLEVNNSPNAYTSLLFRWVNRAARKRNKGADLDISYSLEYTYILDPFEHPNFQSHFSKKGLLSKWARRLDRFLEHAKEGKAKVEAEKIRALFDGQI